MRDVPGLALDQISVEHVLAVLRVTRLDQEPREMRTRHEPSLVTYLIAPSYAPGIPAAASASAMQAGAADAPAADGGQAFVSAALSGSIRSAMT